MTDVRTSLIDNVAVDPMEDWPPFTTDGSAFDRVLMTAHIIVLRRGHNLRAFNNKQTYSLVRRAIHIEKDEETRRILLALKELVQ